MANVRSGQASSPASGFLAAIAGRRAIRSRTSSAMGICNASQSSRASCQASRACCWRPSPSRASPRSRSTSAWPTRSPSSWNRVRACWWWSAASGNAPTAHRAPDASSLPRALPLSTTVLSDSYRLPAAGVRDSESGAEWLLCQRPCSCRDHGGARCQMAGKAGDAPFGVRGRGRYARRALPGTLQAFRSLGRCAMIRQTSCIYDSLPRLRRRVAEAGGRWAWSHDRM